MLFAGSTIIFAFIQIVGHGPLWQSILGDSYQRVVKLAVGEFIELSGYYLWLIGMIECTCQAKAIAFRKPQPAAARRRAGRLPKSECRF